MNLDSNNHSVFLLYYHLVLTTQYCKKAINQEVSCRAKEMFKYISQNYNITLQEWSHDMDHVHILFKAHPNTEISKFINAYKSASSRILKKEFPNMRQKLWKDRFWSKSFFLITRGQVSLETIENYIKNQGEKTN